MSIICVALFGSVLTAATCSFKRIAEDALVYMGVNISTCVPNDEELFYRTLFVCAPLPVVIYFAVFMFFIFIIMLFGALPCKLPD